MADHRRIGLEHVTARPVDHFGGVATVAVHRTHGRDTSRLTHDLVVFAETGREVHDAGSVLGGDEVGGQDPEGSGRVGEPREQGRVAGTHEFGAPPRADPNGTLQFARVGLETRVGEDQGAPATLENRVVDVGPHREREVRRQRPGSGGPGE